MSEKITVHMPNGEAIEIDSEMVDLTKNHTGGTILTWDYEFLRKVQAAQYYIEQQGKNNEDSTPLK